LSTAGSELRSRALVWKSLMENDLNSIDKTGRPETVVLRLGFHSSIGSDFVAPVLKALQKSFPQLVLHFHLAKSPEIQSALLRRQLEIGVVVNAVPKAQLIVRRLGRIQSFFYGKLRNGGQLFINPNMVDVQKYLRRLQPQLNVKEVLIPDYDFMAALVKNDVGAALLPEHIARRFHLRPAEVETITAVEFDLSLVYLAEDLSPSQKSVARSFEELLKAQMS
jgi:DNA-binding transcriptional LysR family regulator